MFQSGSPRACGVGGWAIGSGQIEEKISFQMLKLLNFLSVVLLGWKKKSWKTCLLTVRHDG